MITFIAIAMAIIPSMVLLNINAGQGTIRAQEGEQALAYAQTGAEDALVRLLRDKNYAGETLVIGSGTVSISVAGNDTLKTVLATGSAGVYRRTVEMIVSQDTGTWVIQSWEQK